ncbi:MAG: glycosyltransferase family 9 protein [Pseudomonadota bacterium]
MAPASILVIRRDNIGDLVCTTPTLHALRRHFPQARICALVNTYNSAVLERNPDVDRVYVYEKAKHRSAGTSRWRVYWNTLRLILELRRERFDYVLLAGSHFMPHGLRLARQAGARHVIGYVAPGQGDARGIDVPVKENRASPGHEVENVFELLRPLGIEGPAPKRLQIYPDPDERRTAHGVLREQPGWLDRILVAVQISARESDNQWPLDNFAELMRAHSTSSKVAFVLLWSPGDASNPFYPGDDAKAHALMQKLKDVPVLPYRTPTVASLIGALSVCDIVVCCDSGTLHVAAALGKPILGFYCEVMARRWAPWGVPHVQLVASKVRDIRLEQAREGLQSLVESRR